MRKGKGWIGVYIVCLLALFARMPFAGTYGGIYKVPIRENWNLISMPLLTIQLDQGKSTALGTSTITDSAKSWTVNGYQYHFLLITSGSGEGYLYKISSNTANTLTLSSALSSSISAGDKYWIYKAYTLTELFGSHTGPLKAASNKNDADEIYLWDATTQAFSTSFWLCNTSGQEGWWQGSTKITDNSVTLIPNQGCFVVHKSSATAYLNFVGDVPTSKHNLVFKSGDNLEGEVYPTAVTVANSGLASVVKQGTSSATADNLYFWNYGNQAFDLPVWKSNYPGYENWYQGANVADSYSISPGVGFQVKNKASEKTWSRTKPYSSP